MQELEAQRILERIRSYSKTKPKKTWGAPVVPAEGVRRSLSRPLLAETNKAVKAANDEYRKQHSVNTQLVMEGKFDEQAYYQDFPAGAGAGGAAGTASGHPPAMAPLNATRAGAALFSPMGSPGRPVHLSGAGAISPGYYHQQHHMATAAAAAAGGGMGSVHDAMHAAAGQPALPGADDRVPPGYISKLEQEVEHLKHAVEILLTAKPRSGGNGGSLFGSNTPLRPMRKGQQFDLAGLISPAGGGGGGGGGDMSPGVPATGLAAGDDAVRNILSEAKKAEERVLAMEKKRIRASLNTANMKQAIKLGVQVTPPRGGGGGGLSSTSRGGAAAAGEEDGSGGSPSGQGGATGASTHRRSRLASEGSNGGEEGEGQLDDAGERQDEDSTHGAAAGGGLSSSRAGASSRSKRLTSAAASARRGRQHQQQEQHQQGESGGSAGGKRASSAPAEGKEGGGAGGLSFVPRSGRKGHGEEEQHKMSISKRRAEEDRLRREAEEKAVLDFHFIAKPVPETTKRSQFLQVLAEQEERRRQEHAERSAKLAESIKPFKELMEHEAAMRSRMSAKKSKIELEMTKELKETRKFKANPVPAATANPDGAYMALIKREQERPIRVATMARALQASSTLPERMALALEEEKRRKAEREARLAAEQAAEKREARFRSNGMPDFQSMHAGFFATLNDTRKNFAPTASQPFSFDSKERQAAESARKLERLHEFELTTSRSEELRARARSGSVKRTAAGGSAESNLGASAFSLGGGGAGGKDGTAMDGTSRSMGAAPPAPPPGGGGRGRSGAAEMPISEKLAASHAPAAAMTRAVQLRMLETQRRVRERQEQEQKAAKEEEDRLEKLRMATRVMAPIVQKFEAERNPVPLAWQSNTSAATAVVTSATLAREKFERESRQRAAENKARIESAQQARPLLMLRSSVDMQREAARTEALMTVAKRLSQAAAATAGSGHAGMGSSFSSHKYQQQYYGESYHEEDGGAGREEDGQDVEDAILRAEQYAHSQQAADAAEASARAAWRQLVQAGAGTEHTFSEEDKELLGIMPPYNS